MPHLDHNPQLDRLIDLAFDEDFAQGDATSLACVPEDAQAEADVVAKEALVVAGLDVFARVFARLDPGVVVERHAQEGELVQKGAKVVTASGSARSLLMGERTALNFLQRLSGIATLTRDLASALHDTPKTRLLDTRKTTPGMRALEKAAVRAGGGHNHRFGLFDGVMIKENHIAAAGGIAKAVARARAHNHHLMRVEVETTSLSEVEQALQAGADCIMLDNMDNATMREAVALRDRHQAQTGHRATLEASGNMSKARLPGVGQVGVDFVSVGALTHSARAVDLSMLLRLTS